MNKLLFPVVFAFALTTVLGSQETFAMTVLFDEPLDGIPENAFFANQFFVADDFVLTSASSVTDLHFVAGENPGGFTGNVFYTFYENNGGFPGAPIPGASGTAIIQSIGLPIIGGVCGQTFPTIVNCFEVWTDLPTPVPLAAGTYWVAINGDTLGWGVIYDDVFTGFESQISNNGINWSPIEGGGFGLSFTITGQSAGGVGGELIPIDTRALLLYGVQTNLAWIVPVASSAVGIGLVLARKKF